MSRDHRLEILWRSQKKNFSSSRQYRCPPLNVSDTFITLKIIQTESKCQSNDRLPPVTVGSGTLLPLTCSGWVWCASVGGCYCVSCNWAQSLPTSFWWTRRPCASPSVGWTRTVARSSTPASRWQQGSTRRRLTTTGQLSDWRSSPCCHAICHDRHSWLPADPWSLQVSIYGHMLYWILQIPFEGNAISGDFAKLRKPAIFLLMCGCSSFCSHVTTRLPLHGFVSKLILEHSSKNMSGGLMLHMKTQTHLWESPAEFFLLWEIVRTKVVLNIKTHLIFKF